MNLFAYLWVWVAAYVGFAGWSPAGRDLMTAYPIVPALTVASFVWWLVSL